MKRLILSFLLLFPLSGWAAKGGSAISRGGLGFIFNDHNSFSNPGQFALENGTAFAADYSRTGSTEQEISPSLVLGTGGFGFGVFGSREASLSDSELKNDSVGAGVGVSMDGDKITLGLAATRSLDENPEADALLAGTFTINGPRRMGFGVGAGMASTLNHRLQETRTGTVAIGYGVSSTTSFEVNGQFNDLNNVEDVTTSGVFNTGGQQLYFSGSVGYLNLVAQLEMAARIGVILGKVDFSGLIKYSTQAGVDPTVGGSLRMLF